jgi:hypothetical protein
MGPCRLQSSAGWLRGPFGGPARRSPCRPLVARSSSNGVLRTSAVAVAEQPRTPPSSVPELKAQLMAELEGLDRGIFGVTVGGRGCARRPLAAGAPGVAAQAHGCPRQASELLSHAHRRPRRRIFLH